MRRAGVASRSRPCSPRPDKPTTRTPTTSERSNRVDPKMPTLNLLEKHNPCKQEVEALFWFEAAPRCLEQMMPPVVLEPRDRVISERAQRANAEIRRDDLTFGDTSARRAAG